MVGNTTGEAYRLGDAVTVKLVEAVPLAGALRFELVSDGRFDSAGAKRNARTMRAARPGRLPRGREKKRRR